MQQPHFSYSNLLANIFEPLASDFSWITLRMSLSGVALQLFHVFRIGSAPQGSVRSPILTPGRSPTGSRRPMPELRKWHALHRMQRALVAGRRDGQFSLPTG